MAIMTVDQLEMCIDAWHDSDSRRGIREYLGMTSEQFLYWRQNHQVPEGWVLPLHIKRVIGR